MDKKRLKRIPLAEPGYPWVLSGLGVIFLCLLSGLEIPATVAFCVTFFFGYFFRDPERRVTVGDDCVLSPADGKIVKNELVEDTHYYAGPCRMISIFMSVFDVHVNRVPYGGEISRVEYVPGKFFSADLDKASALNERNALFIEDTAGRSLCVVQIAGLVARRIVCPVQVGDTVERGRRFGMIRFGSRLDVYLPPNSIVDVEMGKRVKAGITVLGRLR